MAAFPIRSSAKVVGAAGPSRRSSMKRDHQRSLRYTRTLDIIPEDDSGSSEFTTAAATTPQMNQSDEIGNNNNNIVITTDFWHSQRILKKSAANVSLGSLLPDASGNRDDRDPLITEETPPRKKNDYCSFPPCFVVEDDHDDDYSDNYILEEDWDF